MICWFHDFHNDINGSMHVNHTYKLLFLSKKSNFICALYASSNQTMEKENFVISTYAIIVDK